MTNPSFFNNFYRHPQCVDRKTTPGYAEGLQRQRTQPRNLFASIITTHALYIEVAIKVAIEIREAA